MAGHSIYFQTRAFRDPPETVAENCNLIEGHGCYEEMRSALSAVGHAPESTFDEDYGWAFFVNAGDDRYFIFASLDPSDQSCELREITDVGDYTGEDSFEYPVEGTLMFCNVNIEKQRSLLDRILGKNKQTADDPVTACLVAYFRTRSDIEDLKTHPE